MTVQQQQFSEYDVYNRLWINRSRGYVYGTTITLSRQSRDTAGKENQPRLETKNLT